MVFHMLVKFFRNTLNILFHLVYRTSRRGPCYRESLQDSFDDPTIYRDLMQDFDEHNWNTEFELSHVKSFHCVKYEIEMERLSRDVNYAS